MPIEAKSTDNGIGLIRPGNGVVEASELIEAHYIDDAQLGKLKYWILDLIPAEWVSVSMDCIRGIVDKTSGHAEVNPNLIIAVAVEQKVCRAMATMVKKSIGESPLRIGVFDALDEAKNWITEELRMDLTFE